MGTFQSPETLFNIIEGVCDTVLMLKAACGET